MITITIFLLLFLIFPLPVSAVDPAQSVVTVESRHGQGTGFFVNPRGFVLTNHHVTRDQAQVDIHTATGRKLSGILYYSDHGLDLALYRVDAINTTSLPLETSKNYPFGEIVFGIGSPLGLEQYENQGILERTITRDGLEYLQVNMKAFPGISGSPLFTEDGKVIGINTLSSGDNTLALPADKIVNFLKIRGIEFNSIDLSQIIPSAEEAPRQLTWERFGSYLLVWNFILFSLHIGLGIYNYRVRRGLFQPNYPDGKPLDEEDEI